MEHNDAYERAGIRYRKERDFAPALLADLFGSVGWESGRYPERLSAALRNYGTVWSARAGDRLVGLAAALDDGLMTAYVHYLLVRPDCQGRGIGRELLQAMVERTVGITGSC